MIAYLNQHQPWWYGVFQFGNTLRLLRPSLAVRCVDDPALREEMNPISDCYSKWELVGGPHPFPDYPNMGDHPHNMKREKAMIDNTFVLWDETDAAMAKVSAAILNTSVAHSLRTAAALRERGISYFLITHPSTPVSFP